MKQKGINRRGRGDRREKRKWYVRRVYSFVAMLFISFWLLPAMVQAHGGGELQAVNVPIGSYQVSVWLNPPTVRTGQTIHITVGIATAEDGSPVLDSTVDVIIETAAGEEMLTTQATTEQSVNRLFYEADISNLPTGSYEVLVQVAGIKGNGNLRFPMEVGQASLWPWLVGGLGGGAVIWFVVRRWQKRKTAVSRPRNID